MVEPRHRADRGQRLAAEAERADLRAGRRRRAWRWRGARPRAPGRRASCRSPSSVTRIRRRPPPSVTISIRVAPASSAFSTSSLTTLAGRSTTSPAAMRLTSGFGKLADGHGAWPRFALQAELIGGDRDRSEAAPAAAPAIQTHGLALPQALDAGAAFLALQPLLARGLGRLGGAARHRPDRGLPDQVDQPLRAPRRGCAPGCGGSAR